MQQCDAGAFDRDVDVLQLGTDAAADVHAEAIQPIAWKGVRLDNATARAVRGALNLVPRVLRNKRRLTVGHRDRRGGLVAKGYAADRGRGVQVRLEQRRRQHLHIGNVVEVRALCIKRKKVSGLELNVEQVAHRRFVFWPVQPLERPVARIRLRRPIDGLFERLGERHERVAAGLTRSRWRHHLRPQLADHFFRNFDIFECGIDGIAFETHVTAWILGAVATLAVTLDDSRERLHLDAARTNRRLDLWATMHDGDGRCRWGRRSTMLGDTSAGSRAGGERQRYHTCDDCRTGHPRSSLLCVVQDAPEARPAHEDC